MLCQVNGNSGHGMEPICDRVVYLYLNVMGVVTNPVSDQINMGEARGGQEKH